MKNILIVRVSAIGDVIHTFPAIILLKKVYPHAKIHWVVQKKASALLFNQPFVDTVWELPNHYLAAKNIRTTIATIRSLRKISWDAIIDFQGLLKTSLLHLFLRGYKIGFAKGAARSSITTWFTHENIQPEWKNIIQKNLSLASAAALSLSKTASNPIVQSLADEMKLAIPESKQQIVDNWLTKHHITNAILLAPNTTWLSKHWPTNHWKKLIYKLLSDDKKIILVGSSFGKQAAALAQWVSQEKLSVACAPAWDLLTLSHLINTSAILIAPDTGLLHLADFMGARSLALFGPTLAERHGPFLKAQNKHYAQQARCQHFYKKQHGNQESIDANNNCMYTLTPENVYDATNNYLTSQQTPMVRNVTL